MNINWKYLIIFIIVQAFFACTEGERLTFYDTKSPAPVAINPATISVENFSGKSVVKYHVPSDDNLLYVKAVYETSPDVLREAKASLYVDTLLLEGFPKAGDYKVKFYSVGKNEKQSEATEIIVSPLTPPVIEAFPSLDLAATFGGIRGSFINVHQSELKVTLLADTIGDNRYTLLRSYTSNSPFVRFTYLGLSSKKSNFAAYLQDRWGNRTDTLFFKDLTPLFEEKIDKSTFEWYRMLPSDLQHYVEEPFPYYNPVNLWDGSISFGQWWGWVLLDRLPFTHTIRLGKSVILSRITIYQMSNFGAYRAAYNGAGAPRSFEIYGSNLDRPDDNLFGSDWTLLGRFESEMPSGKDMPTQADKDYAWFEGDKYFFEPTEEISNPYKPTKFIRFRFLRTWNDGEIGDLTGVAMSEIDVFGTYVQ